MSSSEKKHTIKYFSVWRLQNRLTLFSLMAILVLSALIAAESALLPRVGTTEFIAFIVLIPTFACFGIATCHSSNLESEKARHEYQKLSSLFSEAEGSQITLDRFFSISSDLMAVAGKNGYLKKVSKSLVDTLGYSEETLLNTPFVEFIHPDDREITHKHIEWLNLGGALRGIRESLSGREWDLSHIELERCRRLRARGAICLGSRYHRRTQL